jgi:hypothetical protein
MDSPAPTLNSNVMYAQVIVLPKLTAEERAEAERAGLVDALP